MSLQPPGSPQGLTAYKKIIIDAITIVSTIIGLLFPVGGLIYYALSLEGRVSDLEKKVNVIITAPSPPHQLPTKSVDPGTTNVSGSSDSSGSNALIQQCMNLYAKETEAVDRRDVNAQGIFNAYLQDLGCTTALKAQNR